MSCKCENNCLDEIESSEIVQTLQFVYGLDFNGCPKYSSPLQNGLIGCDLQPLSANAKIVSCEHLEKRLCEEKRFSHVII